MTVARHVRVTGRVQGVFFRQSAADKARALGVSGWARNCADGSVELHLEGAEDDLKAMIEWLHSGPPAAAVSEVRVEEATPLGCTGFQVRR